jgi:quinoprotein glucose dehydrogenase
MRRFHLNLMALFLGCTVSALSAAEWRYFGADAGAMRYSQASLITPDNVRNLIPVWQVRTKHLEGRSAQEKAGTKFQATPILVADRLVVCTPFNQVIALDPETGQELWRFDPTVPFAYRDVSCRGVAAWTDRQTSAQATCSTRILTGTNDARVIALDAATGRPCEGFGDHGEIRIRSEEPLLWPGEFQINSPPVVVNDVVIVGSSLADNLRVKAPRGTVRAFDVRNGSPRWTWDPIPTDASNPAAASWGEGWRTSGHANVWAPMSVDEKRRMVFLPTSSPSPDYFGGHRPGNNLYSDTVVALNADNGALLWHYQVVHHDLWDYDLPAQPTLATLNLPGGKRDVVIQGTKQGMLFVLDRDTGEPIWPIEERSVPQGAAAGEWLSPTQPFPTHVPQLAPHRITPNEAYGLMPWDRGKCRDAIASARNEGIYTPPSERGSIKYPSGAIEWGGLGFDPERQILYANPSQLMERVTLQPAAPSTGSSVLMQIAEFGRKHPGSEWLPQLGAPHAMKHEIMLSPLGLPCNAPPWGTLAAIDLRSGKILWESTVGTSEEKAPLGLALKLGGPNMGGFTVTRGGVIFIGAVLDRYLRAFDASTGRELWQGRLPSSVQATPMTYERNGRQYVVVAVGGHRQAGTPISDTIVAFALPSPNEAGPTLWSRTIDRPGGRFKAKATLLLLLIATVSYAAARAMRSRRARAG